MKIGIIENKKKLKLSIITLLEILGFQPIVLGKNNLKNINSLQVKAIIINARYINEKNKNYLVNFLENKGKMLLYGKPSNQLILEKIFNIKILKLKGKDEFGYIEKNFIKHLQKNRYFNERKIPFSVKFLIKWKNCKEFGKIIIGKNKSAIAYMNKIFNAYVMYIIPDIFEASYSLLTDQNDKYRKGIFRRNFPIDSLLYVYSQILSECINILFKDGFIITKWHWPNKHLSAISLTHDIDTEYGSRDGVEILRKVERKYKVNSVWFFRPGDRYKISKGIIKNLLAEGCEIGLHSINKGAKDKIECRRQKEFIEKFTKNKILGVRSHALSRIAVITQETDKATGFIYESTIPDTDNCVPNQKFKGNTIFFPYNYYFANGLGNNFIILPLTIHDWWYIIGNKWLDKKTIEFYLEKTDYIRKRYGLNMVLVHPESADYRTDSRRIWMYDKYINHIKKIPRLWISNADIIAKWVIRRIRIKYSYQFNKGKLIIQIEDDGGRNDVYRGRYWSLLINGSKEIDKIEILDKNHEEVKLEVENLETHKKLIHMIML